MIGSRTRVVKRHPEGLVTHGYAPPRRAGRIWAPTTETSQSLFAQASASLPAEPGSLCGERVRAVDQSAATFRRKKLWYRVLDVACRRRILGFKIACGMTADQEPSAERRVLDHYPAVRDAVLASPAFVEWRSGLPTIEIDGARLYVRGGDMLRDEDQVIFEWARRNGLLSDEAIASALKAGEP